MIRKMGNSESSGSGATPARPMPTRQGRMSINPPPRMPMPSHDQLEAKFLQALVRFISLLYC